MREIIKLKENGFCYGVKNAIEITNKVACDLNYPRPIYLLGNLVHNEYVKVYLEKMGIIILDGKSRLEMVKEINYGTVIFSAHGVSGEVAKIAFEKGLTVVDSTCPYVKRTFKQMENVIHNNYKVIFVGKPNHPETEAALAISPNVHLYDVSLNKLIDTDLKGNIALCHQTTMSSYDIEHIFDNLKKDYPNMVKLDMICNVTEKRQQAIIDLGKSPNLANSIIIVVGDKTSNNSTKLYEMAKRINSSTLFINTISDLNLNMLKKYSEIYLISGTSTPQKIIDEIYDVLNKLDIIDSDLYQSSLTIEDYIK